MARTARRFTFGDTQTISVPVGVTGNSGRIAVFARRLTGSGTATVAVRGSFTDLATDTTNTAVQVTAPSSIGTGVLTQITADANTPYAHLHIVYVASGTLTAEVFVVSY